MALKEETENAKKTEVEAGKKLKELEYKVKHAKELKEKEMKASRNLFLFGLTFSMTDCVFRKPRLR